MFERINYYGNSREVYDSCKELINQSNRKHADIVNLWFLLVNVLYLICAQFDLLNVDIKNRWIYGGHIAAIIAFIALMILLPGIHRFPLLPTVLNIAIFTSYGISVSNANPYMIAFMYLIILLVIAMSYIETMLRMTTILVICSVVFIYQSQLHKPISVAYEDLCNTVIVLVLSLVLHFRFQMTRLEQFITFNQNLQIRKELEVNSSFDSLTSLFNRGSFFSMGGTLLREMGLSGYTALCMLDLDGFKQINDEMGHQVGDKAIQLTGEAVANVLGMDSYGKWEYKEKVMRETVSFAGRLGGDEFILLLRDKGSREEVSRVLDTLLQSINRIESGDLHGLKASFGVTEILPGEKDMDMAYKRADDALYASKRAGKNQISWG